MIKIYGAKSPLFMKTILAAEELGLPYQHVSVDLAKGEEKSAEHIARHPFGRVPVIEHEGNFIMESNTIVRYMGDLANSSLYPKERVARAHVEQWMDYFSSHAGRFCTSAWFNKCIGPVYFGMPYDEKAINDASQSLLLEMPIINDHLSKNTYVAGKDYSLADINAYMLMKGHAEAGFNLSDFPHFLRWFKLVDDRPLVKKVNEMSL